MTERVIGVPQIVVRAQHVSSWDVVATKSVTMSAGHLSEGSFDDIPEEEGLGPNVTGLYFALAAGDLLIWHVNAARLGGVGVPISPNRIAGEVETVRQGCVTASEDVHPFAAYHAVGVARVMVQNIDQNFSARCVHLRPSVVESETQRLQAGGETDVKDRIVVSGAPYHVTSPLWISYNLMQGAQIHPFPWALVRGDLFIEYGGLPSRIQGTAGRTITEMGNYRLCRITTPGTITLSAFYSALHCMFRTGMIALDIRAERLVVA